jgi:hypothetical protein
MKNEKSGDHRVLSFEPDVYYDIVSTARNSDMSIEDVARRLLSFILDDKEEIEEVYNTPIIVKEEKYEEYEDY